MSFLKNKYMQFTAMLVAMAFTVAANAQVTLPTAVTDGITEAQETAVLVATTLVAAVVAVSVAWVIIRHVKRGIRSI